MGFSSLNRKWGREKGKEAERKGILVIAAAGNEKSNIDKKEKETLINFEHKFFMKDIYEENKKRFPNYA